MYLGVSTGACAVLIRRNMQRRSKEKQQQQHRRKNSGRRLDHREESPTLGGSVRTAGTILGSLSGPSGKDGITYKHIEVDNASFDP